MIAQIFIWWLASTALGLAGLPLTTYLFRALPDRGYAFARGLGLLLTGYLAWLAAMLGLAPFGAGLLVVCAVVVFGLGVAVQRPRFKARTSAFSIRNAISSIPHSVIFYEIIFLVALIFIAMLRARNPVPWGTERPMDFALFNAIQRSQSFPPHDPWLSGFSINYYYLGYLLMASMALLTGLAPAVAYNLSLALVFALTAVGIAGVVSNLIQLTADTRRQVGVGRWLAVVLSIIFVLLAGNQGGVLQLVTGTPQVLALSGRDMLRAVANGLGSREQLVLEEPFQEWGAAEPTQVISPTNTLADFNWWNPSRALYDHAPNPQDPTDYYAITEFPMFSFWLGDMHPHVMALPFGLLALALAFTTLTRPAAPVFTLTWRGWLELILTGVVLGSLYMINSWDFPTYLLLYLAALFVLYARLGGAGATPSVRVRILWQQLIQQALLVVVASFVLFAPFYMTFKSLVGAKPPLIDLPIFSTLTRTIGFVTWDRTPLHTFVIIFGLFALPLVGFVFVQGRRVRVVESTIAEGSENAEGSYVPSTAPSASSVVNQIGIVAQRAPQPALLTVLPWVVLGALVIGVLGGFPLLFLLPLAVYAFLLAIRQAEQPGAAFPLLGAALGALVCFGTEIVYIRDTFEGGASRMNTIFKFYYQIWLVWGTIAGYAVWWMLDRGRRMVDRSSLISALASTVVLVLTALLFGGALAYPLLTAGRSLREAQVVGLNGKTPREQTAGGAAGITWLRENADNRAIVLESVGGAYDLEGGPGSAGVSASTGFATVLGWPGHEAQWRGGDAAALAQIEPRKADVETIYSTTDGASAGGLLARYGVDYVYIGEAERRRYDSAALGKFAQLGEVVFQQDEVVIYRVSQ